MKNKRLSDQILILQAITCVRDELIMAGTSDVVATTEIQGRLYELYALLRPEQIISVLKIKENRSKHGRLD